MGRQKAKPADLTPTEIDEGALQSANEATKLLREHAGMDARQAFLAGQISGSAAAFRFARQTAAAAEISQINKIKESKTYLHSYITFGDGNCRPAATWDEFCTHVLGRSRSAVDEEIDNLKALDDMFDLAKRLGLNRSHMRSLRALPAENLEEVKKLAKDGATKETLLSVLGDTIKEKEALANELESTKGDLEGARTNLAKRQKSLDKARDELEDFKGKLKTAPADEAMRMLREALDQAKTDIHVMIAQVRRTLSETARGDVEDFDPQAAIEQCLPAVLAAIRDDVLALAETHNVALPEPEQAEFTGQ